METIFNKINRFKFKSWHFVLLFITLFVITNILGTMALKNSPTVNDTGLTELDNLTINDIISTDVSFVLFYKEDSELCDKMEYNLCLLSKEEKDKVKYYKLNIEKYPGKYSKHDVSGTPSILIYKEGKEIDRIVGFIPKSNLDIIYNRVIR
jgi:thioredoxin-like negative regulator of GroEL